MCPVTDTTTGETRDVDLLQELILMNGLIDSDWFSIDPKKRLRTWLRPERRLALRQWKVGDTLFVCGMSKLDGRVAHVLAFDRKRRRFKCRLDGNNRPVVKLRADRLCAMTCDACHMYGQKLLQCSGCGLVHYCGASCQKAGWRAHKAACKAAQKKQARQQRKAMQRRRVRQQRQHEALL